MPNRDDNNNYKNNENNENIAKKITSEEINRVNTNPSTIKVNGCCMSCVILLSRQNACEMNQNLLIFYHRYCSMTKSLNESFIEMVENLHMKQRMMGVTFSIKTRESKDKFIDSNLRNVLSELSADLVNYGTDIVLRKLVITSISLEIAQNLGIDYHAATEELYYYMRRKDQDTRARILEFIDGFYEKVIKSNKG